MNTSKKLLITLLATNILAAPLYAADASTSTSTGVTTGVTTTQDSGMVIGDKAHIKGDVYTGSNRADTSVSTDVSNRAGTSASDTSVTSRTNNSYNNEKGKGHKYGHDKH